MKKKKIHSIWLNNIANDEVIKVCVCEWIEGTSDGLVWNMSFSFWVCACQCFCWTVHHLEVFCVWLAWELVPLPTLTFVVRLFVCVCVCVCVCPLFTTVNISSTSDYACLSWRVFWFDSNCVLCILCMCTARVWDMHAQELISTCNGYVNVVLWRYSKISLEAHFSYMCW